MTKIYKTIDQIEMIDDDLIKSIYNEITKRDGQDFNKKCMAYLEAGLTPAVFEAKKYNIYDEYSAMTKFIRKRGFRDNYEKGRYKVLEFMLNCIIAEPIDGNYYSKENSELAKEAGRLLSSENAMRDGLVWSFIPKRFQRDIDVLWDGIGGWRS